MPGLRRKARNSGAACALTDFQREISRTLTGANRITVVQQADLYLDTQQNLEKSTRENKGQIIRRIKESWPGGSNLSLDKVWLSHVAGWLSPQGMNRSASSLNSFIEAVCTVFALAVRDRLLPGSPAAGLKYQKRKQPIRRTPTLKDSKAVAASAQESSSRNGALARRLPW